MRHRVNRLRSFAYKIGFRPKFGSILYSPSLAWFYAFKDADIPSAFYDGLTKGK